MHHRLNRLRRENAIVKIVYVMVQSLKLASNRQVSRQFSWDSFPRHFSRQVVCRRCFLPLSISG
ncbi:MAG: hypothetical protein CMM00_10435 [Rhodopirellula sp.]|nr:hypothetical protein [Rhodopirellula sp.]